MKKQSKWKQERYPVKIGVLDRMINRLLTEKGVNHNGIPLPQKVRVLGSTASTKPEAWEWAIEKHRELMNLGIDPIHGAKRTSEPKVVVLKTKREPKLGQRKTVRVTKYIPAEIFYSSREWKEVRYEALKLSDGRCCLCGRSYRENGVIMHADHIKPRSVYPHLQLEVSNIQILCEPCNIGKSNFCDRDWREG